MSLRQTIAECASTAATGTLRHVFHRPAENFPGKLGLYLDPQLIGDLASRLREGSVVVVGTNGKTTVTNLLADALEQAGKAVACNRTGANLDSGVATALLHAKEADWGVFESDELWLAKIAPHLQPAYVVLLNLFRDQLDRMGEIDHIQASIADALASSPATTLVYNCDDPLCQAIADRIANKCIPFGMGEDLGLAPNTVADAGICQRCDAPLEYSWRQYGQLGAYRCPTCGFARSEPAFAARNVHMREGGLSFTVAGKRDPTRIEASMSGAYMAYNLLAVSVAAECCGVAPEATQDAIRAFAPQNGRLQRYEIDGRPILLNLAKNPTGFNQNLRIIAQSEGPAAAAFFINDKEADGHDVSWLWDVDFQELAALEGFAAFAGGTRRHDMQVRLKYAGLDAPLVDGATDFLAQARAANPDATPFLIANYTALPGVKAELDGLGHLPEPAPSGTHSRVHEPAQERVQEPPSPAPSPSPACAREALTIVHWYPDLMNLYGDGGNVTVLAERARRRGIGADVVRIGRGQKPDFARADIVFLGGGPDREQRAASRDLMEQAADLRAYVEDDGVLLAICGGFQILGRTWLLGDETVEGLGILDMTTGRAEGGSHNRLVGNIALRSPLADMPVVGYENHAGRTFLGPDCQPFGDVANRHGHGNNDTDRVDGARYRNVVGTYLHGPLLAKNPEVADWLLERALERRAAKDGRQAPPLQPLDDTAERAANAFMCDKLGVK